MSVCHCKDGSIPRQAQHTTVIDCIGRIIFTPPCNMEHNCGKSICRGIARSNGCIFLLKHSSDGLCFADLPSLANLCTVMCQDSILFMSLSLLNKFGGLPLISFRTPSMTAIQTAFFPLRFRHYLVLLVYGGRGTSDSTRLQSASAS